MEMFETTITRQQILAFLSIVKRWFVLFNANKEYQSTKSMNNKSFIIILNVFCCTLCLNIVNAMFIVWLLSNHLRRLANWQGILQIIIYFCNLKSWDCIFRLDNRDKPLGSCKPHPHKPQKKLFHVKLK